MTYDELMNDGTIQFVVFNPSPSKTGAISILRKSSLREEDLKDYQFDKLHPTANDIVYFKGVTSMSTFV